MQKWERLGAVPELGCLTRVFRLLRRLYEGKRPFGGGRAPPHCLRRATHAGKKMKVGRGGSLMSRKASRMRQCRDCGHLSPKKTSNTRCGLCGGYMRVFSDA